eukprot:15459493-Alexandrium_andersonii.AAC.1
MQLCPDRRLAPSDGGAFRTKQFWSNGLLLFVPCNARKLPATHCANLFLRGEAARAYQLAEQHHYCGGPPCHCASTG